jgi:hypothetical protein
MPDTTEDPDGPDIRPFSQFLTELRKGAVHDEASKLLHDLIAAVQETRKSGSLTLTIGVDLHKDTDMLVIKDAVTTKLPRLPRPASIWYVDADGNPSRNDPQQLVLNVAQGLRTITPGRKNA